MYAEGWEMKDEGVWSYKPARSLSVSLGIIIRMEDELPGVERFYALLNCVLLLLCFWD